MKKDLLLIVSVDAEKVNLGDHFINFVKLL